jgi:hypothetical protein
MNIVKVDDFNYQLIARLHNEEFEPQPPQNLELIETSPNGQSQPLVFKQDPNEPQKFSLKREKNNSGSYQYDLTFRLNDKEVKLSNSHHQQVEHIETQWDDGAISRLRSLCHSSEGKVIEPHQLDNFYKFIPVKKLTQLEVSYDPLWDKSFIWIPLVLLLCLEWGLRRKWGLS